MEYLFYYLENNGYKKNKKGEVSQESYENLCLNFNPLLTVLNSIH